MPEGIPKIKIKPKDLGRKSTKELLKMREDIKLHLQKAYLPKNRNPPEKGFNISQEKKNIARIKTELRKRR